MNDNRDIHKTLEDYKLALLTLDQASDLIERAEKLSCKARFLDGILGNHYHYIEQRIEVLEYMIINDIDFSDEFNITCILAYKKARFMYVYDKFKPNNVAHITSRYKERFCRRTMPSLDKMTFSDDLPDNRKLCCQCDRIAMSEAQAAGFI